MGAFKLGKMTFGSLFKKPETVQYPIETKPQPEGLKGHISIAVENCILCGMCGRSCPTDCIEVDKAGGTWKINRYSCIQCGYCVTVCPKKCLAMEPSYAPAATQVVADEFVVSAAGKAPRQTKDAEPSSELEKAGGNASAASAEAGTAPRADAVLESKIALMDPAKAEKVREALGM